MKNGQALHTSPYVTQIENTQILSNSFPGHFFIWRKRNPHFPMRRLRICLTGQKKEPAKAVKNVPGAGKRILYIPIRWDMKFYLPSIITGVN